MPVFSFFEKFLDSPVSGGRLDNLYYQLGVYINSPGQYLKLKLNLACSIQVVLVVLELCGSQEISPVFLILEVLYGTEFCGIITLYGRNTSLTILDQSLSEVSTSYRMEIMALFNENFQPHIKRHHLQ